MRIEKQLVLAVLGLTLVLATATADAQQQIITPNPVQEIAQVGDRVTTTIVYSTSPTAAGLTGLGLRLHWPSAALRVVAVRSVLANGLIAEGRTQPDGPNFDGDPQTDRFLQLAWADLSAAWPGGGNVALATVELEVLPGYTGFARLRFSASSTPAGWELRPTPFLVRSQAANCTGDNDTLCLNFDRFQVEATWRDFDGNRGSAQGVPVVSLDSGLLWFFDSENWEMLIKVLDGCGVNNRFWVFVAATTNVEYTLTITDTETGEVKRYTNPLGTASPAITDTDAFATCSAGAGTPPVATLTTAPPRREETANTAKGAAGCRPGNTTMCLNEDRFQAEIFWRDFEGGSGAGQVVPVGSDDSGLFWFFSADNWEVLVKVLDGCGFNRRFWVFAAATTNVEYTLRVTDTVTGEVRSYTNPLGVRASAITDTNAFATCP